MTTMSEEAVASMAQEQAEAEAEAQARAQAQLAREYFDLPYQSEMSDSAPNTPGPCSAPKKYYRHAAHSEGTYGKPELIQMYIAKIDSTVDADPEYM
ncbi:GH12350 [Drosophila grimshawi]|uniref:GH12350 n=1 Tax=Drosophila grimshawi TaxID=7222 RepID=B4JJ27_DROGR|nr:GH12350 [Drosophila grimshawi]